MKKKLISRFAPLALLTLFLAMLASFSPRGGEGFEIYLNNKLVLQKYGSEIKNVSTITLSPDARDKISVRYFHCGKVGKHREITLKNSVNSVVKTWLFKDDQQASPFMNVYASQVPSFTKLTGELKLYYNSSELNEARLLANLSTSGNKSTVK